MSVDYRDRKSTHGKGARLLWFVKASYRLPTGFMFGLSRFAAWVDNLFQGKTSRVVKRNLELCFPELTPPQIEKQRKAIAYQSAYLSHEFATAWLADEAQIKSKLSSQSGAELIEQALAEQRPVIVAVPHIGNWEFFWHWLQFNYPLVGMYQPAKYAQIEELVFNARSRFGGELFATDSKGILGLMRSLKKGKVMMILPDQAPKKGGGVFASFFGQPAYTMTLLHKFVIKTGAQLVFGSCVRKSDGESFEIHVEAPEFDSQNLSVEAFNEALNLQVEGIVRRWPTQYQWTYKRFKRQPDGNNPYR